MIKTRKFECKREKLTIRGVEYRNEDQREKPIAIVSHGFMANQTSVSQYAEKLAELGYAAYTFDFCGGCLGGKSDGKSTDMSVLTEAEDLKSVINYTKQLPYTDNEHLILAGCSQGGFVSALVAAQSAEKVEKLILFYPAIRITDDAKKGEMAMLRFEPDHIPEKIKKGLVCVGKKYVNDVIDMDGIREIQQYKGPVLVIYGTKDQVFDAKYAEKALEIYGDSIQMFELKNEGHGFSKKGDIVACSLIEQFVDDRAMILDIDVRIIDRKVKFKSIRKTSATITFGGHSSSKYFVGTIEDGAKDIQEHNGLKIERLCADYTLTGEDYSGEKCTIHIVNTNMGNGWKPKIECDSDLLDMLNKKKCFASMEPRKEGPRVRIFC